MRAESERAFQEGGDVGALQTMVHPEDVDLPVGKQRLTLGAAISDAHGSAMRALRDASGKYLSAGKGNVSDADLHRIKDRMREQQRTPREVSKWELRRVAEREGKDAAEQLGNERSFEAGGVGGRIEVYAGGAMEWVPNGPGGVPQPTTGDVFYDPIEDAQRGQMLDQLRGKSLEESVRLIRGSKPLQDFAGISIKKLARGGVVRGYENGGDVDLDIEDEIVERTTNPGAGIGLTQIILQGKQDALDRLRAGQGRIEERRAKQQKRAQQEKWFALAQGMLAPTQTGGFGESLGTTAGLMQQQSQMAGQQEAALEEQAMASQQQQDEIEAQMIDQLLEQEAINARRDATGAKGKEIHGRIQTMVKPSDRDKPIAEQELVFGVTLQRPDGSWRLEPLKGPDGEYQIAADRLEPSRVAALTQAKERAEAAEGRNQAFIAKAYAYRTPLLDIRRANELLEGADQLKTSGIQNLKTRLANFLGIDFGDTVDLSELQMRIAQDYLQRLSDLKGPASDRDVSEMQSISVSLRGNTTANYRQLKKMEMIYARSVKEGIRSSYKTKDMDAVADLWEDYAGNRWYPGSEIIDKSKAAYDKLPAGTRFYIKGDWGGASYTKPEEE